MSSSLKERPPLVQKLITSYFPIVGQYPNLFSLSTELNSLFCNDGNNSGYVSETPVSKQGNTDWYLGKCNTVEESPRRALFVPLDSGVRDSGNCSHTTSALCMPIDFDMRDCRGSPTTSCESIAVKK